VVVAEGAKPIGGRVMVSRAAREGVVERLGGVGALVGSELERLTGKDTRVVVLGHLQRGGAPTPADRVLATRFGARAVELVINGQFGMMVANRPPDIVPVPFQDVVGRMKTVPSDSDLLVSARALGVSFGD
jgi:6-phosphofructokinase 1